MIAGKFLRLVQKSYMSNCVELIFGDTRVVHEIVSLFHIVGGNEIFAGGCKL